MEESSQYQGRERRKYPRKKAIRGLTYTILSPSQGVGIIKDISEGGFRFVTDRYLMPGTVITAKFELSREEMPSSIEAIGRVVWCKLTEEGYVVGVQVLS